MYKYWGFGLYIASDIIMPELMPVDFDTADVTITIGIVPQNLEGENIIKRAFSLTGDNEYILEIKNNCRYYAGYGKTVIVEPINHTDEGSIRLFLLGTIMAAILYQRGRIPLHASAIVKNGRAILFTGNSGAGKSTLLAHLSTKGYPIFTDDICVLSHDEASNNIYATASYPMLKLWEDALGKLGDDSFNKDFKIRPQLPKYGHFFHDSFQTRAIPVEKVFVLHISTEKVISHNKLNALQAFGHIEKQAYKYRFATSDQLRTTHFSMMAALTKHVPAIQMKRPPSGTSIHAFADLVESLF